jgi:ammonia channel protein AmtB
MVGSVRLLVHEYVDWFYIDMILVPFLICKDYGGSAILYLTAGVAALIGTIFLGPRFGRFEPRTLPLFGHSIPVNKKAKEKANVMIDMFY